MSRHGGLNAGSLAGSISISSRQWSTSRLVSEKPDAGQGSHDAEEGHHDEIDQVLGHLIRIVTPKPFHDHRRKH